MGCVAPAHHLAVAIGSLIDVACAATPPATGMEVRAKEIRRLAVGAESP